VYQSELKKDDEMNSEVNLAMSVVSNQCATEEPEFIKKFATFNLEMFSDATTQESRSMATHDVIGKPLKNFSRSNETGDEFSDIPLVFI
jgi:hypothetical protein